MSILERARGGNIPQEQPTQASRKLIVRKALYEAGSDVASIVAGPIIRHWTETIDKGTELEFAPDFDEKFAEAVENGCLIAFEANHISNYDAEALALVNHATMAGSNSPETTLPMAKSQFTGDQGFWNYVVYKASKPLLAKYHIKPIPTTTFNDINSRNIDANPQEHAANMRNGTKSSTTIAVLPEASVFGGKINPKTGKLNGMQTIDPKGLRMSYLLAKRQGKPFAVIPVSIRGSNEVLNPDTKRPNKRALLAGLHYGDPHIVDVYIGAPLRSDKELAPYIEQHDWEGATNFVGKKIAKHLNEEQRGVYA